MKRSKFLVALAAMVAAPLVVIAAKKKKTTSFLELSDTPTEYFTRSYYLGPDGDDKNPGTLHKPFASFKHACNIAQKDDVIYCLPGYYKEAADPWVVDGFIRSATLAG
jgi:hypothetical protein